MTLRPHVKTHKTAQGAKIQQCGSSNDKNKNKNRNDRDAIVNGFVASTLPEIKMILLSSNKDKDKDSNDDDDNNDDLSLIPNVLYGVPITKHKLALIQSLRNDYPNATILIMVDHIQQFKWIQDFVTENNNNNNSNNNDSNDTSATPRMIQPFPIYLKLDTGYHRAGVPCYNDDISEAILLAKEIINHPQSTTLHGLYSHCGHAYNVAKQNKTEMQQIIQNDINGMIRVVKSIFKESINAPPLVLSIGSTPSFVHHSQAVITESLLNLDQDTTTTTTTSFNSIDFKNYYDNYITWELHPGNYTFYDRQQLYTGSCQTTQDIACRVMATVMGMYSDRDSLLLNAGATALTKDTAPQGQVCQIVEYPHLQCIKMSQECITVQNSIVNNKNDNNESSSSSSLLLPSLGDMVSLLPNHSCLAAACFDKYYIINDPDNSYKPDTPIVDVWIPVKGFEL